MAAWRGCQSLSQPARLTAPFTQGSLGRSRANELILNLLTREVWQMKSKQILLSLIPILGSIFYSLYLFLQDPKSFIKSALGMVFGMLTFMLIYGGFATICNAISLNLMSYMWLVWLFFYISGVAWNCVFFVAINKAFHN